MRSSYHPPQTNNLRQPSTGCLSCNDSPLHVGLESLESVVSASGVTSLGGLPVDHLPDVVDVRGLAVEVLEIVGMLPHVYAEERGVAHDDSFLVGQGDDSELSGDGFLDEPL